MNCYDFERNISAYLEGEIKQAVRSIFDKHKSDCNICNSKLLNISNIVKTLPNLSNLSTSEKFEENLKNKINDLDNRKQSLTSRFLNMNLFGLEPLPAISFCIALIMILGASYFLLNQDNLPVFDHNNISSQVKQKSIDNRSPLIINPIQDYPSIADSDSLNKINKQNKPKSIKLVRGN